MKIRGLIFLFLLPLVCYPQITWKRNFLAASSSTFSIASFNAGVIKMGAGNGFLTLDSVGKKIYQKTYMPRAANQNTSFISVKMMLKMDNERLVFNAGAADTCNGNVFSLPAIFIIDTAGNQLNGKRYRLAANCSEESRYISMASDSGFAECGIAYPPPVIGGYTKPYVLRVDDSLNVVWAKYFDHFNGGAQFIQQLYDSSFIIGFNLDTVGIVLARTDQIGNFLWCKSYFRPKGILHEISVNEDGTFEVIGYTDSSSAPIYPPGFDPKLFLMKLDTTGTVMWCKTYDTPNYNFGGLIIRYADFKKTSDGGFILALPANFSQSAHALLIKTDSNGDTLWTKWHGRNDYHHIREQVFPLQDGGYVVGGMVNGSFPQGFSNATFIYKTDSSGNSPCLENWDTVFVSNLLVNDSDVVLSSIDGAIAVPSILLDSIYPSYSEYNTCLILTTDRPTPMTRIGMKMLAYPNPNYGDIIVKTDSKRKKMLSIFNSSGVLMFEKKSISENEIHLDLSRYTKGTYLIKVDDGKEIQTQKVTVQ